jgi:hypothetical protein
MHVESVRAVERDDERQVRDLATEVQVHRVKQPEKPEEEDAFEHARSPEDGQLVWLRDKKKTVYPGYRSETGEIIQQVPSDEMICVARNIEEFLISDDPKMDFQN